jgi:uncharacterized membrane protein
MKYEFRKTTLEDVLKVVKQWVDDTIDIEKDIYPTVVVSLAVADCSEEGKGYIDGATYLAGLDEALYATLSDVRAQIEHDKDTDGFINMVGVEGTFYNQDDEEDEV